MVGPKKNRRTWRIAGLLAAVLGLKLIVVWQVADHPLLHPDAGLDTTAYARLAARAAAGDLALGPGLYYVSPLYIYWLAAVLALTGSFDAARVCQAGLGTATVGLIFLTARAWFTRRAAWAAAALAAGTGLFTFYEALILQSSIDAFLTAAALWVLACALRGTDSEAGTIERWLAARPFAAALTAGAVFGLHALNRPNIPIAVGAVAIGMLAAGRARLAPVLVAGLLAGMAPAAVRNVVVAGEWSAVSSHGGLNFYIGNNPRATGFFQAVPGIRPTIEGQEQDTKRVAEQALGRPLGEGEVSSYYFGRAWTWIRGNPADAAALFARKLGYVFSAHHVALPHSYPFYARDERTALALLAVGPWVLIPLGLAGLVFAAPACRRREYVAWASFVPGYAIAVAAFFVAERYRLPLFVPLAVGAGAAIDSAIGFVRGRAKDLRAFRPAALPVATFVLLSIAVNWPLGLDDGRWQEGLRTAERLIILEQYGEADRYVERFEPRGPHPGATHYGAARQLLAADQPGRALEHLRQAYALDPRRPQVEYALGQALLRTGSSAEALPHLQRGYDAGIEMPLGGFDLALALQAAGRPGAAADVIRRIDPAGSPDAEAALRVGRLAAQARAPDAAEPFFRHAVELRPEQASARQQLGLNLLVLGRLDEAARELTEAARLDPRDPDTLAHLAYAELQLGRPGDARRHVEAALAIDAGHDLAGQLAAHLRIR